MPNFEILDLILSTIPSLVIVLNQKHRIIYANQAVADFLQVESSESLLGHYPGEIWRCEYATTLESVCGEAGPCDYCGAKEAILQAKQGRQAVSDCRILRHTGDTPPALEFRIWTTPLSLHGEGFIILAAQDISDEKRRQALERIFFHDILNTAHIISGAAELLTLSFPSGDSGTGLEDAADQIEIPVEPMSNEEVGKVHAMIRNAAQRLIEEIKGQRQLVAIENHEVEYTPSDVKAKVFLQSLLASYRRQEIARGRTLVLASESEDIEITTDRSLLSRILNNLIKNAVEAELTGVTITAGCRGLDDDRVEFWVHNPSVMSEAVQHQLFQRTFSTKGRGRGLGTYSAKLLTERYLGGEIDFHSEPGEGTTFYARYPVTPDRPA